MPGKREEKEIFIYGIDLLNCHSATAPPVYQTENPSRRRGITKAIIRLSACALRIRGAFVSKQIWRNIASPKRS